MGSIQSTTSVRERGRRRPHDRGQTQTWKSSEVPTGYLFASTGVDLAIWTSSRWPNASRRRWTSISPTGSCWNSRNPSFPCEQLIEELRLLDEWIEEHHGGAQTVWFAFALRQELPTFATSRIDFRSTRTARKPCGAVRDSLPAPIDQNRHVSADGRCIDSVHLTISLSTPQLRRRGPACRFSG